MTKDEALKKAFKQAFQLGQDYWYQADHESFIQNKKSDVTRAKFKQLMEDAIEEALSQPEPWEKFCDSNCVWTDHHPDCKLAQTAVTKSHKQEPVAWYRDEDGIRIYYETKVWDDATPLYTTPPQRPSRSDIKPLTDEELRKLADKHLFYQPEGYEVSGVFALARAIEVAHGIKD